jgi:hypothetical protein
MLVFGVSFLCSAQNIRPLADVMESRAVTPHREAVYLQGVEYMIPQLIVGGEWTSTITLVNRGTRDIPGTNVYFVDNMGNPMRATFRTSSGQTITDTGFNFFLGAGALIEGTFVGGSAGQFGSALIGCSSAGCGTPGLYGEVTLRNRNSTRPDFESVFPFESPGYTQHLLFDGRNGIATTLYLINASTSSTTILIDVINADGRTVRTISLPFRPGEAQIQTLHVLSQETIGIQGILTIRTPTGSVPIVATGLRINPSNSFTPLRAFVPKP